ncbi:hypothetical protein EIN_082730 [Entamoeba invadens IP1]|uniref:hypothetical protein n=1 Tax=Entamoeba invadens IP1 TaxID=370355 RepID=UPI0002C3E6BA|nr:hypothetical protein EIN_082730 [Entamoeba invadens IP1]ELP85181.1 hypothetical protein EIN_082730 [Entamoeba invadens IP1]|eukprot:XP_004184527.1 hypothetical protein EIN_082730 [Entamoeba invadens IP1]
MSSVKIVVLGPAAVGKTAITIRLVNRTFRSQYDPTIEDCFRTTRSVEGTEVCLEIYMTIGNGFIIVYSITNHATFYECDQTVDLLLKIRGKDAPWVLVGNKVDLETERQVTKEEATAYAQQKGAICLYETSAKNNINIEDAFITLTSKYLATRNTRKGSASVKDKKQCLLL